MSEAVPEVWAKSKIGSLISEISQKTTSTNQYEVLSVTKDGIQSQREYFKKQIASEDNTGYKVVHKGNLVFGTMNLWMGSLDVLKKTDIGIVSPAYKTFKFNSEKCGIDFMSYYMRSPFMIQKYIMHSQQGASIVRRNLDLDQLLEDVVSIPPLPEQKKIAAILTSVDEVIDATQKQIDKLQDLKKATMNELLTKGIGHTEFKDSELGRIPKSWVVTTLAKIGDFSKGKGISKAETTSEGIPCIRYAEIYTDYDILIDRFKSFIAPHRVATTKKLKTNDIIFAGSGETVEDIGKSVAFVSGCEAYVGGDSIVFSPKVQCNSIFLSYQLNDDVRRIHLRKLGQGSSVIHIYSSGIMNLNIFLPPMSEQNRIAETLLSYSKAIVLKKQKLTQTQSLKKSLMQDLLTGKVRVKVD